MSDKSPTLTGTLVNTAPSDMHTSLCIGIPEYLIKEFTKQSNLEIEKTYKVLEAEAFRMVEKTNQMCLDTTSMFMRNLPTANTACASFPSPGLLVPVSASTVLKGESPVAVLVKGKILNLLAAGLVLYPAPRYCSVELNHESVFKDYFVYSVDNFVANKNLVDSGFWFREMDENKLISSRTTLKQKISTDKTYVYWNNKPVTISIVPGQNWVKLDFSNGNTLECRFEDIRNCPEIWYNANLLLARFIETTFNLEGITNPEEDNSSKNNDANNYDFLGNYLTIENKIRQDFGEVLKKLLNIKLNYNDNPEESPVSIEFGDDFGIYLGDSTIKFPEENTSVVMSIPDPNYHFDGMTYKVSVDLLIENDTKKIVNTINYFIDPKGKVTFKEEETFRIHLTDVLKRILKKQTKDLSVYLPAVEE